LREKPLRSCFTLDDTIVQFVEKSDNPRLKQQWAVQSEKHRAWQQSKRLGEVATSLDNIAPDHRSNYLIVGDKIDVRSRDYIWSEGILRLIIEVIN
jgi:hypothetical protein